MDIINLTRGRPRLLASRDCLGLVLAWTRTRGSLMALQMIFGSVFPSVDRCLKLGKRILLNVLVKHPSARICIPTREKIEEYMATVQDRHSNHPSYTTPFLSMGGGLEPWSYTPSFPIYLQLHSTSIVLEDYIFLDIEALCFNKASYSFHFDNLVVDTFELGFCRTSRIYLLFSRVGDHRSFPHR